MRWALSHTYAPRLDFPHHGLASQANLETGSLPYSGKFGQIVRCHVDFSHRDMKDVIHVIRHEMGSLPYSCTVLDLPHYGLASQAKLDTGSLPKSKTNV